MSFREVSRKTERIEVVWGDLFEVSSDIVTRKHEVGEFLLRIGADLSVDPKCIDGTVKGATYYVERWLNYAENPSDFKLGLDASTILYDKSRNKLIGVCMVGGGMKGADIYDIVVDPDYRNQGLGAKMIQRALNILNEKEIATLNLWRNDGDRQSRLYERLGFIPTGRVGKAPPSYEKRGEAI